jgi:hypothetical protein
MFQLVRRISKFQEGTPDLKFGNTTQLSPVFAVTTPPELTMLPLGPSSPGGPFLPGGPAAPDGPESPFSPISPLGPFAKTEVRGQRWEWFSLQGTT